MSNAVSHRRFFLKIGAEMKIAIGAGFPAKWNMNVNTGQERKK
jgi:hypothetical protein